MAVMIYAAAADMMYMDDMCGIDAASLLHSNVFATTFLLYRHGTAESDHDLDHKASANSNIGSKAQ